MKVSLKLYFWRAISQDGESVDLFDNQKRRQSTRMLKRKILTAMVASFIFALVFMMDGFSMNGFLNLFYINLMISITYGVSTSVFSDWLSKKMTERTYAREIISFLFHCFFGLILLVLGFLSAILFFIVDRLFIKANVKIGWTPVIIAFTIVVVAFFLLINS